MTNTVQTMFDAIVAGCHDSGLDDLMSAIKDRKLVLERARVAAALTGPAPKRRVRFNYHTRPAYMRGMEATIVSIKGKRATVVLDFAQGRFNAGREIKAPLAILDVI